MSGKNRNNVGGDIDNKNFSFKTKKMFIKVVQDQRCYMMIKIVCFLLSDGNFKDSKDENVWCLAEGKDHQHQKRMETQIKKNACVKQKKECKNTRL